MRTFLLILLAGVALAGCTKEEVQQPEETVGTVFVRIQVVDEDGTITYTTTSYAK